MAVPAGRWVFNNADSPFGEIGTLRKRATDILFFLFDLGDVNEIVAGETIASAVVSAIPDEDLTFYGQVLTTYSVGMNITGGISGRPYSVTCTVTTSGGSVISRTGILVVTT